MLHKAKFSAMPHERAVACDHNNHQQLVLCTSETHGFRLRLPPKAASVVKTYYLSFFKLNDT